LHAAEDAVSEALVRAVEVWGVEGVPANPEAWLLVVARRKMIDAARKGGSVRVGMLGDAEVASSGGEAIGDAVIEDDRLKLLFVCAHPAVEEGVRAALLLRCVLGVEVGAIAGAFLVSPSAMAQRLVRAKGKIRDAGIRFEVPGADEIGERAAVVLEAVYAAYVAGFDGVESADGAEALRLADLYTGLRPDDGEGWGLLALILYCESRRGARAGKAGEFVPLDRQDVRLWDRGMIARAESALRRACGLGVVGRFQVEAAIQSAHVDRLMNAGDGAEERWAVIVGFYELLEEIAPSLGARLGRIGAVAEWKGAPEAFVMLEGVEVEGLEQHQPYWALRARLLARLEKREEARRAYERAAALAVDAGVRAFLEREREEV
jgi:RNA polymerase sigma-70 factor (ECF subfamily)